MGRPYTEYLEDESLPRYTCNGCSVEIASSTSLVWEGFMGAQQPAMLFRTTINTEPYTEQREERLSTGLYTLVDLRCRRCSKPLGWQYVRASNMDQKYKEGGALLQLSALTRVCPEGQPEQPQLQSHAVSVPAALAMQGAREAMVMAAQVQRGGMPGNLSALHPVPVGVRRPVFTAPSGTTFCPPLI